MFKWGKALVGSVMVFCLGLVFPLSLIWAETAPPESGEVVPVEPSPVAEKLPEIEVRAFAEKAATSTVVTKEDISTGPYQNLPGYLEEQAGVDMTRRSFLGVRSRQLTLRGFDESRYQIYLNGRSWKGAGVKGGFYVDWSTITPADLERLEIIRGGLSAEYPNTWGGVITINTLRGSKEPKLYFDTYYGSWQTQNYRLLHTGGYKAVEYSLGASFGSSYGYLRNNFINERGNFSGSLTYHFPWGLSLTGAARYFTQNTGWIVYNRPDSPFYDRREPDSDSDGLYGPPVQFRGTPQNGIFWGDRSHSHTQRYELDLEVKQKFWHGEAVAHLFYFQAVREDFMYAMNNPNLLIGRRGSWDEDTWGWNFKVRQTPGKVRLGFGLEGNYYGYGGTDYSHLVASYYRVLPTNLSGLKNAQKLHGGFVDAAIPFLKYFEIYLGLRYDNYDAAAQPSAGVQGLRRDALSPKSTLTIRPTDTTEAYLSVNYNTRFPTIPEFYWFWAGYQPPGRTGNLSPEFGLQYEAGLTQKLPWEALFKVRTYYYDINDYIRTVFAGYQRGRVIYNLDLVKFRGLEVEAQLPLPYNLTAFANYTWQQTSASGDPLNADIRKLTELPTHKANIGLRYKGKNEAEGKIYLRVVSKRTEMSPIVTRNVVTGVTEKPMKGFFTVNLEGRYPVAQYRGLKGFLYFGVENLSGEFYEESAGFPMPTQTLYGGLQLRY